MKSGFFFYCKNSETQKVTALRGVSPRPKFIEINGSNFCQAVLTATLIFIANFQLSAQIVEKPLFETNRVASVSATPIASEKAEPVIELSSKIVENALVSEDLIHFGDIIDVDIIGSIEYDWRGQLDSEGFLSQLPYAENPISALCRTEADLVDEITAAYKKMLRNPQVAVRVIDRSARQRARILGAVGAPAQLQIERPVRLNELIVLSGGISEQASGEISIFRPANLSCEGRSATTQQSQTFKISITDLAAGNEDANFFVRTGDIVTVEEAKPIFVIGGVVAPQPVLFRNQKITLSRALASAGGLSKDADAAKITIYRRINGATKIIEADYDKIKKKQAEDIVLEASDIIEVAQRGRIKSNRPTLFDGWNADGQHNLILPLRIIN